MPVKDLIGRPRVTDEQRALKKELFERRDALLRRRPGHSDGDDGLCPVGPTPGPSPMPLAGAVKIADD